MFILAFIALSDLNIIYQLPNVKEMEFRLLTDIWFCMQHLVLQQIFTENLLCWR